MNNVNNTNMINNGIPVYEFLIDDDLFKTVDAPTQVYLNKIQKIWQGYEKNPEMKNYGVGVAENHNQQIINELWSNGIFYLNMVKRVFDQKIDVTLINGHQWDVFTSTQRVQTALYWEQQKRINPFIGLFWFEDQNGTIMELDWLPIPNRNMAAKECYSANIMHYNNEAWLVIFKHTDINNFYYYQSIHLGKTDLFYNEEDSFSAQKMIEVGVVQPYNRFMNVVIAWDMFYCNRFQYFMGEHPYNDILDPVEVDDQDKTRMFLIWLNRIQEFVEKIKPLHESGQTVILSKEHNEMNGEYIKYNLTYTPEIRQEILNKKESFKLYAIANDWFIK